MRSPTNTTTARKLGLLVLSAILCVAVVMVGSAIRLRGSLESERELETRNLVDVAHAIVAHHHSLAQQGVLPEEAAKAAALGAVEQLRYGERGYFWISDRKSAFLMHPFEPELVGNENASSARDCKALLDRFAEAVRHDGQGFVTYRWPKPGTTEPVRKLSFVRAFTPWGWIIGTGVFVDDIDARFFSQAGWFLASLVLIAAAFIFVAWRIARSILDPLGGEPAFVAEIANRVADGELEVPLQAGPGDGATVVNAIARMVKRLRSDVKQAEEELARASRLDGIGRLAGGIAHDFNNLLMVVLGAVHALREGLGPDHPLHEEVVDLADAAERAATLTRQLLAFGRRSVATPVTLDLDASVADATRVLGRLVGEDVELVMNLAREPLFVVADPAKLQQVLLNLIVNARDAMPRGGRITIETRASTIAGGHPVLASGDFVVLAIRDTGCGMSAEVRRHLFEPFFTTKGLGRGTGLGLATVFGIVKQSGGHVEVESAEGAGSCFSVYLPRAQPPAIDERDRHPRATPPPRGETILVVEDEGAVLKRTTGILERAGYVVVAANGPDQAVVLHGRCPGTFDLLLTDVIMPRTSGPDLASRLREQDPKLRVLLMSGYTDEYVSRQGSVWHGTPILEKPFDGPKLLAAVGAALADEPPRSAPSSE